MYVPIMSSPLPFGEVIKVFTWNKSDKPLPASSLLWHISFNQKQQGHDPPSPENSRCIIFWGLLSMLGVSFGNEMGTVLCWEEEKYVKIPYKTEYHRGTP